MKESSNKKTELLELQNAYRNGTVAEKDLSKEQINQLKELYQAQIEFLKKSIEKDKEEILKIRKKLS